MERISGWVSAVGAAVALNDLDGDGLSNDVCYVDPRTDQVILAPVPGTPARYQPFELDRSPLPFDAATMAPMGCLPGDFNEDGLIDILVYYWGRAPVIFLRADHAASHTGSIGAPPLCANGIDCRSRALVHELRDPGRPRWRWAY